MPGNRALSDDTKVQSSTGIRWWQLSQQTEMFYGYELRGPWMPTIDWKDMAAENFPGCSIFSKKELVKRTPYGDYRSMMRAISSCGSEVHLFKDGPIVATAPNSFDAGIARVIEKAAASEAANYFATVHPIFLPTIVSPGSESAIW
jgi:hypothetical protein